MSIPLMALMGFIFIFSLLLFAQPVTEEEVADSEE
jgi:hypothetical protein